MFLGIVWAMYGLYGMELDTGLLRGDNAAQDTAASIVDAPYPKFELLSKLQPLQELCIERVAVLLLKNEIQYWGKW